MVVGVAGCLIFRRTVVGAENPTTDNFYLFVGPLGIDRCQEHSKFLHPIADAYPLPTRGIAPPEPIAAGVQVRLQKTTDIRLVPELPVLNIGIAGG